MALAYIGLGANLGDRSANLETALNHLDADPDITVTDKSGVLETAPVEYTDQPCFLNQVISVQTSLSPEELLARLLGIEARMGRARGVPKGPRLIDLDILLYDSLAMNSATLVIPHPGITTREFVLAHLVELDPSLRDPATGKAYRDILAVMRRNP
ncbi:MAG TPA: 2-amino-4-hydroxy-6-hydroxymethyldihydropteridine diphosphokinase [Spirochaetota bacterium]|nr:2-amino-4-hydroxy-6-hydroxymethyldihydropteridine diphosphokinase [Spirochaetota bacterium]HPI88230.1 2-amino-4-hydroxy-6-hydroxymethyldihydropteridine diphosphokinase [Spirochaetota bacterium]HPR47226.1 2-amino-4-hydroxy-6-hydroxymethyldihydropteridine diphosphokinase [Spirochaetota bacterium]